MAVGADVMIEDVVMSWILGMNTVADDVREIGIDLTTVTTKIHVGPVIPGGTEAKITTHVPNIKRHAKNVTTLRQTGALP